MGIVLALRARSRPPPTNVPSCGSSGQGTRPHSSSCCGDTARRCAGGDDVRVHPGRCRGGRAGGLARGLQGARTLRGPLLPQDMDLPDPDQHRQDAGRARGTQLPFSSRAGDERATIPPSTPTVLGPDHRWAGHWAVDASDPHDERRRLLARRRASGSGRIEALPGTRAVTRRDVDGFDAAEACEILGISRNWATSGCCSTGPVPRCGPPSKTTRPGGGVIARRHQLPGDRRDVNDYVEGLGPEERRRSKPHLNLCDGCADYLGSCASR